LKRLPEDILESDLESATKVLEHQLGLAQADVEDTKRLLYSDTEFLLEFFLHQQLEFEVPEIHHEVFSKIKDLERQRLLLAIPRDHAKTTLAKLGVIWYFLFTKFRFCVYLSNTSPIAKNACRDIIAFLQSENFKTIYGSITFEKESETEGLWIFRIPGINGEVGKRCILRAMGAGQQVRGLNIDNQRPDLLVSDDLEDRENTKTEALQKALDEWVYGTLLKALGRRIKIIWIGNMLARTSLLSRLSAKKRWNPVVYGALVRSEEGLVPLWPDRWPLKLLMEDYQEEASLGLAHIWMAEMMNMPVSGGNGFSEESIFYDHPPIPEEAKAAFICVDAAFTQQTYSNKTAIAVHVIREDACPIVADYWMGKAKEGILVDRIAEKMVEWNVRVVGLETGGANSSFHAYFKLAMAIEYPYLDYEIAPLSTGNASKLARITPFIESMARKNYAIPLFDLTLANQIMAFDKTRTDNEDDLLDAAAYGLQMIDKYLFLIMASAKPLGPNEIRGGKPRYGISLARH